MVNSGMKRILFLAPQPFFEVRGTPINVRLVVTALCELGHEVDLLVFPHGDDITIPNMQLHRVMKIPGLGKAPIGPSMLKIAYDKLMIFKAVGMLLMKKYDAIHAVEEAAFIAWFLSKLFRVPFVFDMDSHISDQLRYSKFFKNSFLLGSADWLERSSLKDADAVVTVCPYLTDVAKRYCDEEKIFQIEDIPQEFPSPPEGVTEESLRAELGLESDKQILLYTGNFEKYQGIDLLIESAVDVAAQVPSARFVLVGGKDETIARYRQMADEQGVSDNVIFTGPRPLSYMPLFHDMADILLSPRLEGTNTPLKIYTYLQTGKPVVATDLPTHTQLLNQSVAALAKPEKVDYAAAILLLLKDNVMRKTLGEAGKSFVEKSYNYEVFKGKIDTAYRSLWL